MPGMASTGNSMSTTGPMTRAMRPTLPAVTVVSLIVAVIFFSLFPGICIGERVHATDNF